jgi:uncharacterized protein (DUF1778 family)
MANALKKENLNVRISPSELALVRRAAEASGKTLSSFVIDAVTARAEEALLDQRFMHVDSQIFDSILETVSKPGEVHPALVELFQNEGKWGSRR